MYDAVYSALVELCTDVCRRNGKTKLLWFGNKEKTLAYNPAADEMLITVHRWFANKSCPGDWLYSRLGDLASKVTVALVTDAEPQNEQEIESAPAPEKEYPERLTEGFYRVRRNWCDGSKGQIGAYRYLSNAKKRADRNPGYSVFTDDGIAIYPVAEETPTIEPEETHRIHTVVRGDTLYEIAKAYLGDGRRYGEIRTLNGLTSNTIYVGMKLKIPG
jgi:LysM repeat protein